MSKRHFTGGGSLDGAVLELPGHVTAAVTTDREGQSFYVLDDQADASEFVFVGHGTTGEKMGKIARAIGAAARAEREAVEAAAAPVGCRSCGRLFANIAASVIHMDSGNCLPDGAFGQLVLIEGAIWDEAWRHPGAVRP